MQRSWETDSTIGSTVFGSGEDKPPKECEVGFFDSVRSPDALWQKDPSGRHAERLWTREGWTNIVRMSPGGEGFIDEHFNVDAEDWRRPVRAVLTSRRLITGAALVTAAVAAGYALRRSDTPPQGETTAPTKPAFGPSRRQGPVRQRTGTVAGMTEVPLDPVLDFTVAGPVTVIQSDGSKSVLLPFDADRYSDEVPGAVRLSPRARVLASGMRN